MRIDKFLNDMNDTDTPLTDAQYQKLLSRFAFHLPIVETPDGEILNPVPDNEKELFDRFLKAAEQRGAVFNPIY